MAKSPGRVAVIGAGIVGVSTALWLQREGRDVLLLDRAGPGAGASFGNGGVLASAAVVPVTVPGTLRRAPRMLLNRDRPLFLRWRSLPRLLPWLTRYLSHANDRDARRIAGALLPLTGESLADHRALSEGTAAARYLVASDYVYLYRDRAAFDADSYGWNLRRAAGFGWREMEGAALRAHDPSFSDALGFGACLPGHGHVTDPGAYVQALARHFEMQGGRLLRAQVDDIAHAAGQVTGLRAGGATLPCDAVVLTAGAHSAPLARKMGLGIPLETERGYHLDLWTPSATPRTPVMVTEGQFVAVPMDGRLRLAGIIEFGGLEAPPSAAPFDLLRRAIRRAMPGLRWAREERWMGHRPATPDSLPVIGPAPGLDGAWLGFGHHHVGLTAGPRTGKLLAQCIAGKRPNIDMAPYDPARFARR